MTFVEEQTVNRAEAYSAAQASVIGTVLMGAALDRITVENGLAPSDFSPPYRDVFQAMLELDAEAIEITAITLQERLGDHYASVLHGAGVVPGLANLDAHCKVVRREASWRKRVDVLTELGAAVTSRDESAFDAHLAALTASVAGPASDRTLDPTELGLEFANWLDDDTTSDTYPSPFPALNDLMLGGFRPGGTTVIGAWSHMGKSCLVDAILNHAGNHGARCHVYVNEMDRRERVARQIARMTGISFSNIITRNLQAKDHTTILRAASALPFGLTDCAGWSGQDIARHIRRHKWDLCAVDLVTRIPARDTRDWDTISGALTDAALQSGSHVILVCQLNLERAKADIKPAPVARDLRNTGSWYNDASNVLFVHRDQEINDADVVELLNDGLLKLEKNRTGRMGSVPVTFDGRRMTFRETSGAFA